MLSLHTCPPTNEKIHYITLEIDEGLDHRVGMAKDYNNIGLVPSGMGNSQEALDYHKKALEIDEGLDDRVGMARDYANIGVGPKS